MRRKPHDGVYCRLAPSAIHGVGVFAVMPIPKGTLLFVHADASGLDVFVPDEDVQALPQPIRKLYTDFAVQQANGNWAAPKCMDDISVGWYVNHSKEPSISINESWEYRALRDIAAGEEIVVDYDTYSPMVLAP